MANFSIRGASSKKGAKEALSLWNELKKGGNNGDIAVDLLLSFKQFGNVDFSESEQAEIKQAVAVSGRSFAEIAIGGILRAARVEITASEKNTTAKEINDPTSSIKGVAMERLKKEYQRLKDFNKDADPKERYRITQHLMIKRVNTNRKAMNIFFKEYKEDIKEHHDCFDISGTQNRVRKGRDLEYSEYYNNKTEGEF